MTEKLKTLKDLPNEYNAWGNIDCPTGQRLMEELRAEAVKWVKNCEYCGARPRCRACLRTMEMNNLTEEDLK